MCYHLDKCQIFSTYSQIPSFPFSIPSPLHPIPHSLAVSSLLPPSLHPCSFLSQMGLCDAEGHRNVSLTYTQPLRLSRFLTPCFTHSHFSHVRMHILSNVSAFPNSFYSYISLSLTIVYIEC